MKMRTDTKYALALTASAALALSSCTGVRVETDDVPQPEGSPIRLAVLCDGEPGTKAMLDELSFKTKGNALQIWDAYYNDVQDPAAYLDGKYVVSDGGSNAVWPFRPSVDNTSVQDHYYWTKTGVHRFYGVLVKDQSSGEALLTPETLFGTSCGFGKDAAAPYKYVVPTTTMTLDSPQFDFLYSSVIERNLDNGGGTAAVPLEFSHLFSAFAFTLTNDSPSEFKITSMSLNVDNVASASIDYSSAWTRGGTPAPKPAYADMSMSPSTGISRNAVNMAAGECRDLFKETVISDASALEKYTGHTLMWPQNLKDKTMTLSYETTVKQEINKYTYSGNRGEYSVEFTQNLGEVTDSKYKSLDYNQRYYSGYGYYYVWAGRGNGSYAVKSANKVTSGGSYSLSSEVVNDKQEKTMTVNLGTATPDGEWKAGKRYLYRLVNSNNEVGLTVTVMKWSGDHGGSVTFE